MSDPLSRTKEIFSKGISAAQQNLESKAKSKRGLSLQDKLTLEVMRLMEASGYANPNSTIYGGIRKSDDPSLILKAKSALNKLTKEELIERLAIALLKIEDLEDCLDQDQHRHDFLYAYFENNLKKQLTDTRTKSAERSKGKASVHTEKYKLANITIEEMVEDYGTINASHAREFYKRFDAACSKNKLEHQDSKTKRNYFKKITGIKSTRKNI